jgi:hypothetical protein
VLRRQSDGDPRDRVRQGQGIDCGTLPVTTLEELATCLGCVTGSRSACANCVTAQPNDVPPGCDPVP